MDLPEKLGQVPKMGLSTYLAGLTSTHRLSFHCLQGCVNSCSLRFSVSCLVFEALVLGGREDNGTPLQYSCLESLMDGGAWWAAVHEVTKSRTQLSDFTLAFHFHTLEKEMATHSSILPWRIPGTGEPGGLPSTRVGSHTVGHD